MLITFIIMSCSVGLVAFKALSFRYFESNLHFYQNVTYVYSVCATKLTAKQNFVNEIIGFCLGIWTPMLTVVVIYVKMYMHLKKRANVRRKISTQDSTVQMQKVVMTFFITVLGFYFCLLPMTIYQTIDYHPKRFDRYNRLYLVSHIFGALANANSCLNPFIYSKIHLRVYRAILGPLSLLRKFIGHYSTSTSSTDISNSSV